MSMTAGFFSAEGETIVDGSRECGTVAGGRCQHRLGSWAELPVLTDRDGAIASGPGPV